MTRPKCGTALFYHRDSAGRAQMAPSAYIRDVAILCRERGLQFTGSEGQIEEMMRTRAPAMGDTYLDYGVKGNILDRPGLNALVARVASDHTVSHVIIPRTDRFARPKDITAAIVAERQILLPGVSLLYYLENEVLELNFDNYDDQVMFVIKRCLAFAQAGKERKNLAKKVLTAQIHAARRGYWRGGPVPYGLRRCLVGPKGEREILPDKRRNTDADCHVILVRGPEAEVAVVRRIILDLRLKSPRQIAYELTREGVPTPRQGRKRSSGRRRPQSNGIWAPQTIASIGRNLVYQGVLVFGKVSRGDVCRYSPKGPRTLTEADHEGEDPKAVTNPAEDCIRTKAEFEPIVSAAEQQEAIDALNRRSRSGKTQRGGASGGGRGGCWIYDSACTWPMYRHTHRNGFRHRCGLYSLSNSKVCHHNTIDGRLAIQFALSVVRQQASSPQFASEFEARLAERCRQIQAPRPNTRALKEAKNELAEIEEQIVSARQTLLYFKGKGKNELRIRRELAQELESVLEKRDRANAKLNRLKVESTRRPAEASAPSLARGFIQNLPGLLANANNLEAGSGLIQLLRIRLFLEFQGYRKITRKGKEGERELRKLKLAVITIGNAAGPVEPYSGPTDREAVRAAYGLDETDKPCKSPSDDSSSLENGNDGVPSCPGTQIIGSVNRVPATYASGDARCPDVHRSCHWVVVLRDPVRPSRK